MLNSYQLILYNDQLHNNNVNQVSNAGILIDGGNLSKRKQFQQLKFIVKASNYFSNYRAERVSTV